MNSSNNKPLSWGVLGTGGIASQFAGQLRDSDAGSLTACASRRPESAEKFAAEFGGRKSDSYDALLADDEIEAVYISFPNGLHYEWSLKALAAGKHVLCEKPIACSRKEAEEMFAAAEKADRYLVEAFMYRQHPAIVTMLETLRLGAVGEVKVIRSNFTFNREANQDDVRYQPELCGGSLMDVGCYCVNLCRAIAGAEPVETHAHAHIHDFGVDDYAVGNLKFPGGVLASFTCGMTLEADRRTVVAGSEGYLICEDPWFCDGRLTLVRGEQREEIEVPASAGRYALEADELARLVREGGEPIVTPADSIGNAAVLEQLRASARLNY